MDYNMHESVLDVDGIPFHFCANEKSFLYLDDLLFYDPFHQEF